MKFQVHLYYNSTAWLYTTFIGANPILKEGILLYDKNTGSVFFTGHVQFQRRKTLSTSLELLFNLP